MTYSIKFIKVHKTYAKSETSGILEINKIFNIRPGLSVWASGGHTCCPVGHFLFWLPPERSGCHEFTSQSKALTQQTDWEACDGEAEVRNGILRLPCLSQRLYEHAAYKYRRIY